MTHTHKRTSECIQEIADNLEEKRVSFGDLTQLFSDRAFGLALIVFIMPNIIPHGIPGVSSITAIPIAIVSVQMIFGQHNIWLPRFLRERTFDTAFLKKILVKCVPYLQGMEKIFRPRLPVMTSLVAERLAGLVILILAGVIFLPIPFGNFVPSLCMLIIALGIIEGDGLLVAIGMAASAATVAGMSLAIAGIVDLAFSFW